MLQVCQLDYGDICSDVSIIDAISEGIQSKKAFEFPILVSGKGSSHTDRWALGRLEWLAIKLRMPTQLVEESNRSEAMQNFWKSLEFVLKSNRWYRQLDIMWWYWYEYLELDAPICQSPTVVYIHVWPRIEAHAVTEFFTATEADNTASMRPLHIHREKHSDWPDRTGTGDLPSKVMQFLARALNVPGTKFIKESIPMKVLDLEDATNVDNESEDRQNDKYEIGCVSDQQEIHESVDCMPELMEDPWKLSGPATPFSLSRWWWSGLIDEAAKAARL